MRTYVSLALIGAIFIALSTRFLERPGLHYDEALEAGLPAVQLLNRLPVRSVHGAHLNVGSIELPLMVQNHIGATQVYLALPFVALFGPTAEALRIMTIIVGLVTIAATFLFMSQMYGSRAALYGCLWLACFPSFIFWSRQGVFVTSITACFIMCALAVGIYGWRTQRLWALGVAALFLGLAAYSKLNAVWVIIGLLLWLALSRLYLGAYAHGRAKEQQNLLAPAKEVHRHGNSAINPKGALFWGLGGFIAGIWPFVLYNVMTGGATLKVVRDNAVDTYLGASNIQFFSNLQRRLVQIVDIIQSGDHLWYLGESYPNHLALLSIIAALVILIIDCLRNKNSEWKAMLFAPFIILVAILLSCFTISDLWPMHFAVIITFPAVVFGTGFASLYRWLDMNNRPGRMILRSMIVASVLLVCLSQAFTSMRYLDAIQRTGGLSFHSSAIYDAYRFLKNRPERLVALDWGIAAQIEYLSGGRLRVEEFFDYHQTTSTSLSERIRLRLSTSELYITHAPYQEAFPHRDAFLQAVESAGLSARPVNVSIRGDGWAIIEVWELYATGAAFPQTLEFAHVRFQAHQPFPQASAPFPQRPVSRRS